MGCKAIHEHNVKQKTGRFNIDKTDKKTLCVNKVLWLNYIARLRYGMDLNLDVLQRTYSH